MKVASNQALDRVPPRAPRPWLIALAVLTVTLGVYAPTLDGSFMWDDRQLILDSARISEFRPLREYFSSSFWAWADLLPGGRSYYRPLSTLSLAIDHRIHGVNAGGYHLTNLVFHGVNALLLFALVRKREVPTINAGLFALCWALFPRLTEAAAWISGRTDVLATFFVLVAFCAALRGNWLGRTAAAVSIVFGLLAKEVATAGLLGLVLFEWRSSWGLAPSRRLGRLAPVALSAGLYAAIRSWAIGAPIEDNGLSPSERVISALEAAGRYVWMLIDGWQPSIQIGHLGDPSLPFIVLGGVTLLAAAVGTWLAWGRLDAFGVAALATFLGSVGLVLHILPITVNIVAADRFLYLPLAALILLLTPIARRFSTTVPTAMVGLLVATYAPVTFARCQVWADEVDFWASAVREQRDHNAMSRVELGNVYARAGLFSQALSLYLDPDDKDLPNYLLARHNAGTALLTLGRYTEAENVIQTVVRQTPTVSKFQFALATIQVALERLAEAKPHVELALRFYPDSLGAQELKKTIAHLEQTAKDPSADLATLRGKLLGAARNAEFRRSKEAIELMIEASAAPDIPLAELVSALAYAFEHATPRQLTTLFNRYTALSGKSPTLRANYEARMERVRRLRELWPTLSAYRTAKDAQEGNGYSPSFSK